MLQELLKQISGNAGTSATGAGDALRGIGDGLGKAAGKIPGGLVGGAAAGGLMALLVSSKSARKFAGKAAGYGGAAVLGGLAYNAYRNWKEQQPVADTATAGTQPGDTAAAEQAMIPPPETQQPIAELTLIKAMIAAGKADGHLDQSEQQRIFQAVEQMALPADTKGAVFDLLQRDISIEELKAEAVSMEQMSEIYLASCLVIDIDNVQERHHLDSLAREFALPAGLSRQLEKQARLAVEESR